MATATQNDFAVTRTWQDVAATLTAIASVDAVIQNIGQNVIQVVHGGASAPAAGKSGLFLDYMDSVQGNAANVWVRCVDNGTTSTVVAVAL